MVTLARWVLHAQRVLSRAVMWGWPHQDYSLTCRYGSKIGCPKAGTPSYLVYYSIQTNNCGPLGLVSITICVCVCPCWCVLGRQGICIISRNDKRPQTWFIKGICSFRGPAWLDSVSHRLSNCCGLTVGWTNTLIPTVVWFQMFAALMFNLQALESLRLQSFFSRQTLELSMRLTAPCESFVHACICNICLPVVPHKAVAEVSE